MIVDKIWKLTNSVRVGLTPRSSPTERQVTFSENVCSYFPPVTFLTWTKWLGNTWQYLSLLCLLRGSSVVWDLYRLTCAGGFWTPPWLTWCGLNKHLRSSSKRWTKRTYTPHTHTLPTHSLTHPYIFTFLCVSHTNTLEVLLHFPHHIPGPTLPTINLVDKRSLLIRSCW